MLVGATLNRRGHQSCNCVCTYSDVMQCGTRVILIPGTPCVYLWPNDRLSILFLEGGFVDPPHNFINVWRQQQSFGIWFANCRDECIWNLSHKLSLLAMNLYEDVKFYVRRLWKQQRLTWPRTETQTWLQPLMMLCYTWWSQYSAMTKVSVSDLEQQQQERDKSSSTDEIWWLDVVRLAEISRGGGH